MSLLEKIKKKIWNNDSVLDSWLEKKFNAYGWRGFVAGLIYLGSGYFIMYYSREIATFLGSTINQNDDLNYQARMDVVNRVTVVILILMVAKLVKQYVSKEEREAHKEKTRKVALMEAEILERKQQISKAESRGKPN